MQLPPREPPTGHRWATADVVAISIKLVVGQDDVPREQVWRLQPVQGCNLAWPAWQVDGLRVGHLFSPLRLMRTDVNGGTAISAPDVGSAATTTVFNSPVRFNSEGCASWACTTVRKLTSIIKRKMPLTNLGMPLHLAT